MPCSIQDLSSLDQGWWNPHTHGGRAESNHQAGREVPTYALSSPFNSVQRSCMWGARDAAAVRALSASSPCLGARWGLLSGSAACWVAAGLAACL